MLRYIKVNDEWIDTLEMWKQHYLFYELDGYIWLDDWNDDSEEIKVGKLQDESDIPKDN